MFCDHVASPTGLCLGIFFISGRIIMGMCSVFALLAGAWWGMARDVKEWKQ